MDTLRPHVVGIALALLAGPAGANDSTAALGTSGLQLVRTEAIALLSEDLYVSADAVRVTYRFKNITSAPVTYVVAFPLPALDAIIPEAMNIVLPNAASPNFVDFTMSVDGKPLTPETYERVTALGVDRTADLRAANLPLNPIADGLYQTLQTLPVAERDRLNGLGLIYVDAYSIEAAWKLETTFWWEQTFLPGKEIVVEHAYRPVVGHFFFGDYVFDDSLGMGMRDEYCMDAAFEKAARARLATIAGSSNPYLQGRRISYILTTANNWSRPIGTFRLTVDKGTPDALVSFCGTGVKKTGPTTFEITATDFVPDKELDILIAVPIADPTADPDASR